MPRRGASAIATTSRTHPGCAKASLPPIGATDVEDAVVEQLKSWLASARCVRQVIASQDAPVIASAIAAAERTATNLQTSYGRRSIVASLVERVRLEDDAIRIVLHRPALASKLGTVICEGAELKLTASIVKLRQGQATKLVIASGTGTATSADAKLIQLLVDARAAQRAMASAPEQSIKQVALAQHQCRHRFMRLLRLAWLAPSIVADICEGRHPQMLTPKKLLDADLPAGWAEQRAILGFT
jgi:hypothetical protein